jgi:hypothetical protein
MVSNWKEEQRKYYKEALEPAGDQQHELFQRSLVVVKSGKSLSWSLSTSTRPT